MLMLYSFWTSLAWFVFKVSYDHTFKFSNLYTIFYCCNIHLTRIYYRILRYEFLINGYQRLKKNHRHVHITSNGFFKRKEWIDDRSSRNFCPAGDRLEYSNTHLFIYWHIVLTLFICKAIYNRNFSRNLFTLFYFIIIYWHCIISCICYKNFSCVYLYHIYLRTLLNIEQNNYVSSLCIAMCVRWCLQYILYNFFS